LKDILDKCHLNDDVSLKDFTWIY